MENDIDIETNKKSKFLRYGTVVILSLITIIGLGFYASLKITYSNGGRSGYIRKFSEKGFVFKTFEGELDKRIQGGTYDQRDIFEFSVADKNVANKIIEAEKTGKWVTIHYKEHLYPVFWRGETPYIVNDVSVSEK